jgi:hypothetical protein
MEHYDHKSFAIDPTLTQANSMSRRSNIELSQQQIDDYCYARKSEDPIFTGLSDQELLYICLSPDQQSQFASYYQHIKL